MNNELESYQNGNRIAKIYARNKSFRVFLFDCYFETQNEKYFDDKQEADKCVKSWILNEF